MGEDVVEKAIKIFIVIPARAIVLIGLYVTASIVDSMVQLTNEALR